MFLTLIEKRILSVTKNSGTGMDACNMFLTHCFVCPMPMNCSGNRGLGLKLQNYCFVCLSVGANNIKTFFYEKAGVTLIGS